MVCVYLPVNVDVVEVLDYPKSCGSGTYNPERINMRYWCIVCQHGVEGIEGQKCPECLTKRNFNSSGILKTCAQAEYENMNKSEAVKLARKNETAKGYDSTEDIVNRMRNELKAELKAEMKAEQEAVKFIQESPVLEKPQIVENVKPTPELVTTASKTETTKSDEPLRLKKDGTPWGKPGRKPKATVVPQTAASSGTDKTLQEGVN